MSDNRFKIVFDGALLPGVDITTAKLNLAELFKSDVSGHRAPVQRPPGSTQTRPVSSRCTDLPAGTENTGIDARIEVRTFDRTEHLRRS
jgi:hypothetical protein